MITFVIGAPWYNHHQGSDKHIKKEKCGAIHTDKPKCTAAEHGHI